MSDFEMTVQAYAYYLDAKLRFDRLHVYDHGSRAYLEAKENLEEAQVTHEKMARKLRIENTSKKTMTKVVA